VELVTYFRVSIFENPGAMSEQLDSRAFCVSRRGSLQLPRQLVSQQFAQRQALDLISDQNESLTAMWTLKHAIDETSPSFGLNLSEFPGNRIIQFNLTVKAVHNITTSPVAAHMECMMGVILVGHTFEDQISVNKESRELVIDYAKLSATKPAPVWYPRTSRS